MMVSIIVQRISLNGTQSGKNKPLCAIFTAHYSLNQGILTINCFLSR